MPVLRDQPHEGGAEPGDRRRLGLGARPERAPRPPDLRAARRRPPALREPGGRLRARDRADERRLRARLPRHRPARRHVSCAMTSERTARSGAGNVRPGSLTAHATTITTREAGRMPDADVDTEAEFRSKLTPEQYDILRRARHRAPVQRRVRVLQGQRHVPLRRVRRRALLLGHQVRLRHRLAELHRAGDRRRASSSRGSLARHAAHRGHVQATAARISATCSPTARARPVACATASTRSRCSSSRTESPPERPEAPAGTGLQARK